jgi:hypothetical protein
MENGNEKIDLYNFKIGMTVPTPYCSDLAVATKKG